jgi:hypothetical protein
MRKKKLVPCSSVAFYERVTVADFHEIQLKVFISKKLSSKQEFM